MARCDRFVRGQYVLTRGRGNNLGRSNGRRRKLTAVAIGIVLCAVVVVIGAFIWYQRALSPVSSQSQTQDVVVSRGESAREVADDLYQKRLIRSETAFLYFYRGHHGVSGIQAGKYALAPNLKPSQILAILTHGEVVSDAISVTIPEGYNVQDIATKLQEQGICSSSAFLDAVRDGSFKEPFLAQLANRKNVRYRLEGFLFPDTYQFQPNEPAADVVNEMLQDFQNRVLTASNVALMKADHLSLNQLITEASLVENEAQVNQERPLIASVIDNRLKAGMKLQIDATVDYALGHHVDVVTDADLQKAKGPYNTYLALGLPPGPIDSPGLLSIQAVLKPAHTDYLYYVAKGDGSGEHYFSKTYSEQLHNEALRAANLKKAAK